MATSPLLQYNPRRVRERDIAIMGSRAVGKSCTLIRFCENRFESTYIPTIEATYRRSLNVTPSYSVDLTLRDTTGQDATTNLPPRTCLGIHGYIFMYSITSRNSFQLVQKIRERLLANLLGAVPPTVLVANKADLERFREVSVAEGIALGQEWGCPFLEMSALDGQRVDDIFECLLGEISKEDGFEFNVMYQDPTMTPQSLKGASHYNNGSIHDATCGQRCCTSCLEKCCNSIFYLGSSWCPSENSEYGSQNGSETPSPRSPPFETWNVGAGKQSSYAQFWRRMKGKNGIRDKSNHSPGGGNIYYSSGDPYFHKNRMNPQLPLADTLCCPRLPSKGSTVANTYGSTESGYISGTPKYGDNAQRNTMHY
eukprot:g1274.t1